MRYLLIMFSLFASAALAGDLATLHSQLADPAPESETCSSPKAPPGTVVMPGMGCPPVERPESEITSIGLERSRCLTNCPAYTVVIDKDGSFRYTGEAFVEKIGDYTGQVSVGQLRQVFAYIDSTDFFALDDSYTSPFLDSATAYTLVEKPGETKVVQNYANAGPATLWALEQLIESLLETAQWDEGER